LHVRIGRGLHASCPPGNEAPERGRLRGYDGGRGRARARTQKKVKRRRHGRAVRWRRRRDRAAARGRAPTSTTAARRKRGGCGKPRMKPHGVLVWEAGRGKEVGLRCCLKQLAPGRVVAHAAVAHPLHAATALRFRIRIRLYAAKAKVKP